MRIIILNSLYLILLTLGLKRQFFALWLSG